MSIRKLIMLAGLALALVALAPATTSAKAGGTDRPFKGTMSGTGTSSPFTWQVTGDETGVATHLGSFSFHADAAIISFTPPNILELAGTFTMVAANGDRLVGSFTGIVTEIGPGPIGNFTSHTSTFDVTITGGTGRFADASGTATDTQVGSLVYRDQDHITHSRDEDTFTGQISY